MKTMITVESLKKKGQNKYLVTTSAGVLSLSEDDIVKYRILKGATFSKEEWEEIKKGKAKTDAFGKVLNYLSFQERTRHEIITYLKKISVSDFDAEAIVERLVALDFINDERFAENYVSSYIKTSKGPRIIKEKLNQKGISDKLALSALSAYTEFVEEEAIRKIIKKEQALKNSYPIRKQKKLIYDRLLRDGFTIERVIRALDNTEFDSNHSLRLKQDFEKVKAKESDQNKIINKLLQKGYEYQEIKKMMGESF